MVLRQIQKEMERGGGISKEIRFITLLWKKGKQISQHQVDQGIAVHRIKKPTNCTDPSPFDLPWMVYALQKPTKQHKHYKSIL